MRVACCSLDVWSLAAADTATHAPPGVATGFGLYEAAHVVLRYLRVPLVKGVNYSYVVKWLDDAHRSDATICEEACDDIDVYGPLVALVEGGVADETCLQSLPNTGTTTNNQPSSGASIILPHFSDAHFLTTLPFTFARRRNVPQAGQFSSSGAYQETKSQSG